MVSINRLCTQILCNGKIFPIKVCNSRTYSRASHLKVTVCGTSSVVGQYLSLLLKQSPYIDQLALYDYYYQERCGIGADLQLIDTKCKVVSYGTAAGNALKGAQVVIILAGGSMTTKNDMQRSFDRHAPVLKEIVLLAAQYCPKALIAVATSPLEGMVPLATEVLKLKGVYNRSQIFGVSTLNAIRANTFAADTMSVEPECVVVPIIGGNTGDLIIPVLTEAKPSSDFSEQEIECITNSVQSAQEKIIKRQSDAAVLSSSFAIARFAISLIKGLKGQQEILECSFVRTDALPGINYMNIPVVLGPNGIKKDLGLPVLSSYEQSFLDNAVPVLNLFEQKAKDFLGIKKRVPRDPCDPNPKVAFCPDDHCEKVSKRKQKQ